MSGHAPVLLEETISLLQQHQGGGAPTRILDCTFGGGGHAREILQVFGDAEIVALDRDPEAAQRAEALSAQYPGRVHFESANFADVGDLDLEGGFDGALFDLGVSSFHLDTPERGFSFRHEGPLDMRMNPNEGLSAAEFLETASRDELVQAVRNYGEEPRWKQVVQAIEKARGSGRLKTTRGLADLIAEAIPPNPRSKSKIHPATLTFQGVRIAVNRELEAIEKGLPAAFDLLRPGGVLAVISFHSLEDRIVKRFFRRLAGMPENRFDSRPQQMRVVKATLLTKRPIEACEAEVRENPRARSAKLRAVMRNK